MAPMATLDRSEFGPNQWLIDEMFRRFQEEPASVGDAWREFFEDYAPRGAPSPDGHAHDGTAVAPAAPTPARALVAPTQPPAATAEPGARPEEVELVPL